MQRNEMIHGGSISPTAAAERDAAGRGRRFSVKREEIQPSYSKAVTEI
jgi:hypothetical protein